MRSYDDSRDYRTALGFHVAARPTGGPPQSGRIGMSAVPLSARLMVAIESGRARQS